jgi:hypothetical protein
LKLVTYFGGITGIGAKVKFLKVLPIITIMVVMLACSFSVNVPSIRTGVSQTLEINEPSTSSTETTKVEITMGAGTLKVASGAIGLADGTIKYNVDSWKPVVNAGENTLTISQTSTGDVGVPDGKIINDWDLKFGSSPIDLRLSSGAYQGTLNLSGLAITNLAITDGASKATVRFDTPNPSELELLSYKTGASEIELLGLGNANLKVLTFDGGVGSYTLDFTGDLKNPINARINSGMSDLKIIVPKNANVVVMVSGGLSNVDATGTWTIMGSTYQSGNPGPEINISISMAVGNLQLIQQ